MNQETNQSITIGNFRILRSDESNIQVDEYKTVKAKRGRYVKESRETQKWVTKGFYSNVYQAANGILKDLTAEALNEAGSVKQLIDAIKQSEAAIVAAVQSSGLSVASFDKPVDGRGRKKAKTVDVAVVGESTKATAAKNNSGAKKRGRPRKVTA